MKDVSQTFEPVSEPDFSGGRVVEERAFDCPREKARSGWRVFRASSGVEVAIHESLVQRMAAFGRRAEPNEWYALLVGRLFKSTSDMHVTVDGAVFDAEAQATRGSVKTTPVSELRTRMLAGFQYPDAHPIGWAHGHVRCGAQYSNVDRANQQTWTQPHSVGVVVDPWDPKLLAVYLGPNSELLAPVPVVAAEAEPTKRVANHHLPLGPTNVCKDRLGEQRLKKTAEVCGGRKRDSLERSTRAYWFLAWSLPCLVVAYSGIANVNELARKVDDIAVQVGALANSRSIAPFPTAASTSEAPEPLEVPNQCVALSDPTAAAEPDPTTALLQPPTLSWAMPVPSPSELTRRPTGTGAKIAKGKPPASPSSRVHRKPTPPKRRPLRLPKPSMSATQNPPAQAVAPMPLHNGEPGTRALLQQQKDPP